MTATIPEKGSVGQPKSRVDGPAKVTGQARYSTEVKLENTAHAVILGAKIAHGSIKKLDAAAAEAAEGVVLILTHQDNAPELATQPKLGISLFGGFAHGQSFFPLQDNQIHYAGQPIAVLVADTLERAEHAATLIEVEYDEQPFVVSLEVGRADAYVPGRIFGGFVPGREERGDTDAALKGAEVTVDVTYKFAPNHHNPLEASCTTAVWEGESLTLYDSTQGIAASKISVAELLGKSRAKLRLALGAVLRGSANKLMELGQPDVRVIAPYIGGGFGAKALIWPHVTLTAFAAKMAERPVKLMLSREQMFDSVGLREENEQYITLGASAEGKLGVVRHHKLSLTSPYDDWAELSMGITGKVYDHPHYDGVYHLIKSNIMTPTFMRGPGETAGMFVLETAMDELAEKVGLDPLEIRLKNYAEVMPDSGEPWSSKGLRECYERGAREFGWNERNPRPRRQRDGHWLIGTGMATAVYPVYFPLLTQRARAVIRADGSGSVLVGTQDFGTGAATAMTQVAADALGVPYEAMTLEYGDTKLPETSAAVGSAGAGMISAVVHEAGRAMRDKLIGLAVKDKASPLYGQNAELVTAEGGRMTAPDGSAETYCELLTRQGMDVLETIGTWTPPIPKLGTAPFGLAFGAQFAEVAVDADLGLVRVRRMHGVFAPGRVLNPKLARSQLLGGMTWGLSQALMEGTLMDPNSGRWANASLGEYLVPVNADLPEMSVDFVPVTDTTLNPLGVKGVGEIGMVGAAAAIANAVWHATGKRIHELPIRVEHLL